MTPARLQAVEEIFHAALDQEPKEIAQFVNSACAGDEALRREVEALLGSHQRASTFIETSPASIATRIIETGQSDLLLGQTFGHYKISKRIGSGGMSEVYLATDVTARRKAALKLLPMRFTGNAERLKRFQQEARAVVALNHPNILTIYEIGQDHSTHYIASELIEGETLRQRLAREHLQVSEAVDVAIQVASALAAAHEGGIVHRDIKPENIMIRPDDYVKVLDFGIAKLAEQEAPATMPKGEALLVETNLGSILGTVRYMSPEQALGAPVDERTDIWSLGVVLYEMLTRHAPFTGDTPREAMTSILEKEPPPLTSYIRQTPPSLQQIIDKTLRKDRDERYPSVHGLLEALKNFRRKLEAESERAAAPLWIRWARSPATLVLVLTIAGLALALPFYWHRSPGSSIPEKSIAVLPFENLSSDEENAFFAGGVQDEILTRLAKIADLKVIARTSTERYKSAPANLPEIAEQLGVANVLRGSVQKADDQVRVNVQLINAATGAHLWAESFDRKLTDIFAVETDIATTVAETLKAKLTGLEKTAIAKRPTANPEAYELYLKGRFFWNKRTGADLWTAIKYFNQALGKDPSYALAYAGLADSYGLLEEYGAASAANSYPQAKAAAKKALELDDTLAEAHTSLANVLVGYDFDFEQSRKELERAIQLNPNYATAHHWYGDLLGARGQFDRAIAERKRAVELDPLSLIINVDLGYTYFRARRYDEAIAQLRKTIEMDPRFYDAHRSLGQVWQLKGQLNDAIAEYRKAVELNDDPYVLGFLGQAYARSGEREEAENILARLTEQAKSRYVPGYAFALIYLALGDKEHAIDEMERAYRERAYDVPFIKVDPMLDDLRGHPRFEALVQRVFALKKTDASSRSSGS